MTTKLMQQAKALTGAGQFFVALAPRLPRMAAATAVVMFTAFAAIQFMPQTFEASLAIRVPAGSEPAQEAAKLIDQQHLGDAISRLTPDIVAELRRDGGGVLDTTALLAKRLTLQPADGGAHLDLTATAGSPARARAIVAAIAESYVTLAGLPPALSEAPPKEAASTAPATIPGNNDETQLLQKRLSLAWEDRIRLESRARRIESLIADGNYAMLALDAENLPSLGRQIDDLAVLEVELEKLSVNLLPNHPRMRVLQEEIDQLSAALDRGMQQLAQLVVADRDAARRLEDGLRDQLIAATAPAVADASVVTGSVGDQPEPKVTALPRPVRTDLVLALSGGLAFFGQIGLFAFLRARRRVPEEAMEPEDDYAYAQVDALEATEAEAHNWLDASPLPAVALAADWSMTPEPGNAIVKEDAGQLPASTNGLDDAHIVAIRCRGDMGAAARRLLGQYERQGRRVVLVDAAGRHRGRAPGISDLSLGLASFADIIHGSGSHDTALVPWGCQAQFDPGAKSVRILVQALAELYDVVILALDSDNLAACQPLTALADLVLDAADIPGAAKAAA
ncbi:hypothetical protein ASD83_17965 [Devosia sp. Root685]|uniref:hypothetical protein n=1 Tax=Devosia sp. Root685 TaxID=1736587 RepID=UPI0006FBAE00|nr:hypothetical protein [Devosia sp. Root685]KRA95543.1 hypothetical protein ASD83_17965 [Devosia sp. Root685]